MIYPNRYKYAAQHTKIRSILIMKCCCFFCCWCCFVCHLLAYLDRGNAFVFAKKKENSTVYLMLHLIWSGCASQSIDNEQYAYFKWIKATNLTEFYDRNSVATASVATEGKYKLHTIWDLYIKCKVYSDGHKRDKQRRTYSYWLTSFPSVFFHWQFELTIQMNNRIVCSFKFNQQKHQTDTMNETIPYYLRKKWEKATTTTTTPTAKK